MLNFITTYTDTNGVKHTTTAQYDKFTGLVTYALDHIVRK